MARPMKPLVRSGGYYPSNRLTPLVYPGGYTTANGGGQPEPEAVLKTVTGSLIHITDALALPAESLSVNVEPIQAGSGDPSPDNVRPISGRTSASVTRTGKNLFPDAGDITAVTNKSFKYNSPIIFKGQTVTLSFSDITYSGGFTSSVVFFIRDNSAGITNLSFNTSTKSKTWTATEDVYGLNFYATSSSATNPGVTTVYHDAQIELGSTASAYEPYQGTSYDITFPSEAGTVYGGTLDVTAGKMVVDMAMVDMGTLAWKSGFSGFYSTDLINQVKIPSNVNIPNAICSVYPWGSTGTDVFYIHVVDIYLGYVIVRTQTYSTPADFKSAITGQQLCYHLATPLEITLTPTQIEMLLGENNLWSDAGDSTLTYYADGNASTSEALGILLGGTYNNPGGADDVSDDEALGILLGGS